MRQILLHLLSHNVVNICWLRTWSWLIRFVHHRRMNCWSWTSLMIDRRMIVVHRMLRILLMLQMMLLLVLLMNILVIKISTHIFIIHFRDFIAFVALLSVMMSTRLRYLRKRLLNLLGLIQLIVFLNCKFLFLILFRLVSFK